MKPLILVRGGGDVASGAVYRLKRAGFPVLINEIPIPTMIRRSVAYGNAVHKEIMELEGYKAQCVKLEDVFFSLEEGIIPVVVEPYKDVLERLHPTVVVDAILAKKNIGTRMDDASLVIGLGPGFEAGVTVDVVVETMRGHTLGRCIYEGFALPNTGIPGNVGGYTHERVIHAPHKGLFVANCHIGETVEARQIIAYVDKTPVKAKISGILRGILTSGLMVEDHFKLADIDARCQESHCYTISDKALAIGGGVLEAVCAWWDTRQ